VAGQKYPATQWPAIIDADTHEKHVVRAPAHLLSRIATCHKCGRGLQYRRHEQINRADSYGYWDDGGYSARTWLIHKTGVTVANE
jgi:hypothetical protein